MTLEEAKQVGHMLSMMDEGMTVDDVLKHARKSFPDFDWNNYYDQGVVVTVARIMP